MTVSLIGKRFGNYDIQAKLGEGGMGMVYLGIHPQIGKRVAIKVLHEDLSSKQDVVSRFFTEAKAVNDISHPNIVDIVDFGDTTIEGMLCRYIIMEFLDGESLSSRIRREGVTIRETLYIIAQAASALAASHDKGVVHRDLKPENIYLCTRGQDRNYVKLLDFGIAKLTGDANVLSQKTRTGMVIGTPAYMSPEQCEGRGNIDHRSDIYALGVVMYELLTGRVPFPGDGFGEVLVAHLTREPEPPSRINQHVPADIEAIVLRCLRKDRTQRFQSMTEMAQALADPAAFFHHNTAQLPPGAVSADAGMGTILSGGTAVPRATGPVPGLSPAQPAMPLMYSGGQPMGAPVLSGGQPGVPSALWPMPPQGTGPLATPGMGTQQLTGMGMRPPTGQTPTPLSAVDVVPVPSTTGEGRRPTTLSGSSGESSGLGRRPMNVVLGLVGTVALSVAVTAGVKSMGRGPKATAQPPPREAAADPGTGGGPVVRPADTPKTRTDRPPARTDREPPPKGQAPAEMVTIVVKSKPGRAEVNREDRPEAEPGVTPYQIKVQKGQKPFDIKLRLDGYKEETRTISAVGNQTIEVKLHKEHHRPVGGKPGGKPGKGDKGSGDGLLAPAF